jgi:hypothetical protein
LDSPEETEHPMQQKILAVLGTWLGVGWDFRADSQEEPLRK